MNASNNDDRRWQEGRLSTPGPLGYVAAAALAVPIGAVVWFEVTYLFFGISGEDPSAGISLATALLAFGLALGWSLYRAVRPAEVVQRGCRLGLLVAALLPVVAIAVLLLWQNASGRRDLGMGGLMLYSLPFVALGVAAVLAIAFGIGSRLAERRVRSTPPPNQGAGQ